MITEFEYNGIKINRRDDGFVNANQMIEASNAKSGETKRLQNFMRLKSTKAYIERASTSLTSELVQTNQGNREGTWIHRILAIKLAQWLDLDFEIWCNAHLLNLLQTGSTSLDIDPIAKMRAEICSIRAEILNETNGWDKDDRYYLPY